MREKNHRRMPWWHELEPALFPPPPWELSRVHGHDGSFWLITTELRQQHVAIAEVPPSSEYEGEQRAAAYLITAAPALFMGAAAMVAVLEDGRELDVPAHRALEILKAALDAARGRG